MTEVNRIMSNLTTKGLLNTGLLSSMARLKPSLMRPLPWNAWMKFLEAQGHKGRHRVLLPGNVIKDLVETFQQELGRLLTPFEIEDLTKTVREDQTDPDVIKAAYEKLSLTASLTGNISRLFCETGAVKASTAWPK